MVLVGPCTYKNEFNLPVKISDDIMACTMHKEALHLHLLHLSIMVLLDLIHTALLSHMSPLYFDK